MMRTLAILIAALAFIGTANASPARHHFSKAQALKIIKTGHGARAGSDLAKHRLTKAERKFALRLFASGPYKSPAMQFFYAVGGALIHAETAAQRGQVLTAYKTLGKSGFEDQVAARYSAPEAAWYGVTIRQLATAETRGMLAGAAAP